MEALLDKKLGDNPVVVGVYSRILVWWQGLRDNQESIPRFLGSLGLRKVVQVRKGGRAQRYQHPVQNVGVRLIESSQAKI